MSTQKKRRTTMWLEARIKELIACTEGVLGLHEPDDLPW
jgi:hypothetical protein